MGRKSASNSDNFDPYHKWLGIPKDKRPPTFYELLAISPNETDVEVISASVDRQHEFVSKFQGGPNHDSAAAILNQLEKARSTLLDDSKRRKYDQKLRETRRRTGSKAEGTSVLFGSGSHSVGENNGIIKTFGGIVLILCVAFAGMSVFAFKVLPWSKQPQDQAIIPAAQVPPQVAQAPAPVVPVPIPVVAGPILVVPEPAVQSTGNEQPKPIANTELAAMPPANPKVSLIPDDAAEFRGHSYKIFLDKTTWHQAKEKCEQLGGQLAIVASPTENEFILNLARRTKQNWNGLVGLWLGATDEVKEGEWVSVDGNPISFQNWSLAPNKQPNNAGGKEHYLCMFVGDKGSWSDQSDDPQKATCYFVCEWNSLANEDLSRLNDSFQAKSVWVNESQKLVLTVVERQDKSFRGRFEIGDRIVREFSGTIIANHVSWLVKDVQALKGGAGDDNRGIISTDNGVFKIDFDWSNEKGASGQFTLHRRQ